jgi:hypothetical protein
MPEFKISGVGQIRELIQVGMIKRDRQKFLPVSFDFTDPQFSLVVAELFT